MVNKSKYYAELNNLDTALCAPTDRGDGPELLNQYADAINSITDDDAGFVAWKKTANIEGNRSEASRIILAAYPQFVQMNFADGTYVTGKETYLTEKASIIAEENRVAGLIDAAIDTAEVEAAQALLSWPTIGGA